MEAVEKKKFDRKKWKSSVWQGKTLQKNIDNEIPELRSLCVHRMDSWKGMSEEEEMAIIRWLNTMTNWRVGGRINLPQTLVKRIEADMYMNIVIV